MASHGGGDLRQTASVDITYGFFQDLPEFALA